MAGASRSKSVKAVVLALCIALPCLCAACAEKALPQPASTMAAAFEKPTQVDIAIVAVAHGSSGEVFDEYKLDLACGTLSEFQEGRNTHDFTRQIASPDNEDLTEIAVLSKERIDAFEEQCEANGFTQWEERYVEEGTLDGHDWWITVRFTDGSSKRFRGHNAYPETWDAMREAFKQLTEQDILQVCSDWLAEQPS